MPLLANHFGSQVHQHENNSLHAFNPALAETRTRGRTRDPSRALTATRANRARIDPDLIMYRAVTGPGSSQPASVLGHSAAPNPQFGRGSVADKPRASRLS